MNSKKAVKDLEKQLRKQPDSLVLRIRLASTLHALGRVPEAVELYRSVAMAYFAQDRLEQAIAVCESLLEIAPTYQETNRLLAEFESHKARRTHAAGQDMDVLDALAATLPLLAGQERLEAGQPATDDAAETTVSAAPECETDRLPIGREPTEPGDPFVSAAPECETDRLPVGGDPSEPESPFASPPVGEEVLAERVPLPVMLALTGLVPPPTDDTALDASEPSAGPASSREHRSGELVPTERGPRAARTPPHDGSLTSSAARDQEDVEGPTHVFDEWVEPPTDHGDMRPPQVDHGSGADGADAAAGAGEVGLTRRDDGMELARALGRTHGLRPEPVLEIPGKVPLMSGLSERAVQAIAAGLVRRRVSAGEMIVRNGDPGESMFVLTHGEARVLKRDPLLPRGELVEISRLGDGDLFGEVAMLSDRRRHASVQAVSDCELLELPRAHLVRAGRRFPEVETFLQQFYRERLIATLLTTASFFRPLSRAQRIGLVSHFRFSHVDPGARIVGEGERAGGFFLIVLGAIEITKRVSERRQLLLATLGEGTYFGEMSLLRGEVAHASVTATCPAEVAVLPAKNFYALVANHPVLWDQVRQEAHYRELELAQIITGVTASV